MVGITRSKVISVCSIRPICSYMPVRKGQQQSSFSRWIHFRIRVDIFNVLSKRVKMAKQPIDFRLSNLQHTIQADRGISQSRGIVWLHVVPVVHISLALTLGTRSQEWLRQYAQKLPQRTVSINVYQILSNSKHVQAQRPRIAASTVAAKNLNIQYLKAFK